MIEIPSYFIRNKYFRWYIELCKTRQLMERNCYVENHHIIPTALGGPNTPENKVRLTGEEHFVAHWLLTKCLEGENKKKMCRGLSTFRRNNKNHKRKLTAKQYEVARKALAVCHPFFILI